MGRDALTHRDDGSRNVPGEGGPWEAWVSAGRTRNWCEEDPLLDRSAPDGPIVFPGRVTTCEDVWRRVMQEVLDYLRRHR